MVDDRMDAILEYLARMERDEEVRVLFAVESGSRAWGFASPDSDFDIRFIYVRTQDWYLSVQSRRDVLETMVDPELDFAGWDLRKALPLLRKSNPSMLEWLGSPIVYRADEAFARDIRELADRCTSMEACFKHYLSMAKSNWLANFSDDQVRLKKYFYVLRPIFACRWIERFESLPPVAFDALREAVVEPGAVADELEDLLRAKAVTSELGTGPHRPVLDEFIEREIARFGSVKISPKPPVSWDELDVFFRRWVA